MRHSGMRASSPIALTGGSRRPEGLYFRVGHIDHVGLVRLIAERKLRTDGLVFDARWHERHKVLRQHADQAGIATCLDTQAMELVMPGTASKGHTDLPWAGDDMRAPEDFSSKRVEEFVEAIVTRTVEGAYRQVMAPAHYLSDISSDWLDVDCALTSELRAQLDTAGQDEVRVIYPLAVHHGIFYDAGSRAILVQALRSLPVDGITLRVHPFGSSSGPHVMRSFIEACWDLRRIETPLMVERAGIAGLSAYALGAVDLVESGITAGDSFDVGSLQQPAKKSDKPSFLRPQRVYVEALGMTVDCKVASILLSSPRGKVSFACKEQGCCPNGYRDMLENCGRHSALARQRQYFQLSKVPPPMRAEYFIQSLISPVCDMLGRARDLHESFKHAHQRTLSVKEVLVDLQREQARMHAQSTPANSEPRALAKVIPLSPRGPRGR